MNRTDLQELAAIRLREAETLLKAGCFDGAYYLSGYVIECALKACIAKATQQFDFPDKDLANASWTHNLGKLVGIAGLQADLTAEKNANGDFADNWNVVKDWTEAARYEQHPAQDATDLFNAVADPQKGVLQWLKRHW